MKYKRHDKYPSSLHAHTLTHTYTHTHSIHTHPPTAGSTGSTFGSGLVKFDVRKGDVSSSSKSAKGGVVKPGEVIAVNIPRELRGRSEILVYLSDKPIRGECATEIG